MNNNFQMGYDGGYMMNGMDPNPGDQMKGTWISKVTGREVTVRDCVISGDGMSVMLADGQMIDMNQFSNEYYQMSEEEYDMNGNVVQRGPSGPNHIHVPSYDDKPLPPSFPGVKPPHDKPCPVPPSYDGPKPGCDCGDKPLPPMPPHHKPCPPIFDDPVGVQKKRQDMVKNVFAKVSPVPSVTGNITLTVENFPKDQLQMLIDLFDLQVEDVAVYLYRYYFTPEKMVGYLKEYLETTEEVKLKDKEIINGSEEDTGHDGPDGKE